MLDERGEMMLALADMALYDQLTPDFLASRAPQRTAAAMVVAGHGFLAVVSWRNGVPRAGNVLARFPNGQLITWLFQVMPLFFFAGGYSNSISWEHRGERDYAQWQQLDALAYGVQGPGQAQYQEEAADLADELGPRPGGMPIRCDRHLDLLTPPRIALSIQRR